MSRTRLPALPIVHVLGDLSRALQRSNRVVLQAPPGAGKTTIVPLALLEQDEFAGKIVMLEPRRLAARAAAIRMAALINEEVGGTVGYRVRLESRVSPRTRIEVVTEGILTRMIQDDPLLEGRAVIVFDEFHERSLHSDLAVTLALDTQRSLREDIRILLMSATIDAKELAGKIGGAEVVRSRGRQYPVEVQYAPRESGEDLVDHVVRGVVSAWNDDEDGDLLVFLPGEADIRRTADRLESVVPASADIRPLYGNLPLEEQDAAIRPSIDQRRKIVLATSIAETSLTIEGVTSVIDSGLIKRPRWSPETGFDQLETRQISRASADQRAGRAGRLAPGRCVRLWSPLEQEHLTDHDPLEIQHTDLARLALEVAAWGEVDYRRLPWPDVPPHDHFKAAAQVLIALGAVDASGAVTAHGRAMAALPVHPRLSHMMLVAPAGQQELVTVLAALVTERDPFSRRSGYADPDITLRIDAFRTHARSNPDFRRVQDASRQFKRMMASLDRTEAHTVRSDSPGELLLEAYPDRVALSEGDGELFRMRSGETIRVQEDSRLAGSEAIVAAHVAGRAGRRYLRLGAAISRSAIEKRFAAHIETMTETMWDADTGSVMIQTKTRLDALVFSTHVERSNDPMEVAPLLLNAVKSSGLGVLPVHERLREFLQRARFSAVFEPALPDLSDEGLLRALDEWLAPFLAGVTSVDQVDAESAIKSYLGWHNVSLVDDIAPARLRLPSGREVPIDYSDPSRPILAVRMQEVYGLTETPMIARGRVPLTLSLLSPANRPLQITRDLAGFWSGEYAEVRKEMRGRYPKHFWPEDPASAPAIRGVRPRQTPD
jgi:ATP-dependent helicase HrpB